MFSLSFMNKKVVLVTGAAGSIGSTLAKKIISYEPAAIRLFDHNENGLFNLGQELRDIMGVSEHKQKVRLFIGDMRDKDRLKMALMNAQIVVDAAALKHVPLCEYNPFEAVATNVAGTMNLIYAIIDTPSVERAVLISTDKSVKPINVMGATKLLAEKLFLTANAFKGDHPCIFSVARFGNVWKSSGSVGEIWSKEMAKGEPLTITDENAKRYMFTIDEATTFIMKVINDMKGGEIFVPLMKEESIMELAKQFGDKFNIIGLRAGEKLREELWSEEEATRIERHKDYYIIKPNDSGLYSASR